LIFDHPEIVTGLAWSPEGTQLAVTSDAGLHVWDAAHGQTLFKQGDYSPLCAAWSPDGTRLTGGTDYGQLLVWYVADAELETLKKLDSSVLDLAWSPDSTLLASASDQIQIWDAAGESALTTLTGHAGHVAGVEWSPDGRMLALRGIDRTVIMWGIPKGQ
jgi:WD40 repeat protein